LSAFVVFFRDWRWRRPCRFVILFRLDFRCQLPGLPRLHSHVNIS
jgi:hypothetical protein